MQSEISKTWATVEEKVESLRPRLLECGVRGTHINQRDRSTEPNVLVADMLESMTWIEETLIPAINKREKCYAELPPIVWDRLNFYDPDNEHQKTLDRFGKSVVKLWAKRPDILKKSKKYGRKRNSKSSVSSSPEES